MALHIDRKLAQHAKDFVKIGASWEQYLGQEAVEERGRMLDEEFKSMGFEIMVEQICAIPVPEPKEGGAGMLGGDGGVEGEGDYMEGCCQCSVASSLISYTLEAL